MKKVLGWIKTNKIITGVVMVTIGLIIFNIVLMHQFVTVLTSVQ